MNLRMNELMRQAARMQRKIDQAKEAVRDKEITSNTMGDKVKATVTYGRKVVRIQVDPELVKSEGLDLVLDGACAAVNAALDEADKAMEAEVAKITGGAKLPGM
jgi:nucleoid-associated protein EbfC